MRKQVHITHAWNTILVLVFLTATVTPALSATYTWVGPAGSPTSTISWNVPSNWQKTVGGSGIPGSNDDVIINLSTATYIHLPVNVTVNSLQIGSATNAAAVFLNSHNVLYVRDDVTIWGGSRLIAPSGRTAGVQVGFLKVGGDLIMKAGSLLDAEPASTRASVLLDDATNGVSSPVQHIMVPPYAFYAVGSSPAQFTSPFPLSWNSSNSFALIGANVQLDIVDSGPQDVKLQGDLMVLGSIRCVDRHLDLHLGNVWLASTADLLPSATSDAFAYSSATYVPPAGATPGLDIYASPVPNPDEIILSSPNFSGTIRKHVTSVADSFRFNLGFPTPTANLNDINVVFDYGTFGAGAFIAARMVNSKHPMNSAVTDYLQKFWILQEYNVTNFSVDVEAQYHTGDVHGTHNAMSAGRFDQNAAAWDLGQQTNVARKRLAVKNSTNLGDFTGGPATKLPVELTSFIASRVGDDVLLKWSTQTEVDNLGFGIERSSDGMTWNTIDFAPGAGNSSVPVRYRFVDELPAELQFAEILRYRLRQIDRDGSFSYSPVVLVRSNDITDSRLHAAYPNPFNPTTTLSFTLDQRSAVTFTVMNASGAEIRSYYRDELLDAGHHTVQFTAEHLPSGVYYVMLRNGEKLQHRKIILTK